MKKFKIKVIRQNRVLIAIFILAVSLPLCLLLATKLEPDFLKIIVPILILAVISVLVYYFSLGNLTITLQERKLNFHWEEKPIFNFNKSESILIDDITKIIVESGILTKIKTKDTTIEVGGINSPYFKTDYQDSIKLLKLITSATNIKPTESWEVWKERGWLTLAYRINLFILFLLISILILYISLNGYESRLIWFTPLILAQLIISHFHMKDILK